MRTTTRVQSRLVRILAVVAIAAPAASYAAQPTAATTDGTPRFAGLTVITADHPGRLIVDLPKPVTLATPGVQRIAAITVTGAGRITGVAIASPSGRVGLTQLIFRSCFKRGCNLATAGHPREPLAATWGGPPPKPGVENDYSKFRLPAGAYAVSIYTDGAPVRVTIRLPGLPGTSNINLRLPQTDEVASPAETRPAGLPLSAQASGEAALKTDVVLLANLHTSASSAHADNEMMWCVYHAARPPSGVVAPGCPDADFVSDIGITFVTLSYRSESFSLLVATGPGSHGPYFQAFQDSGVQVLTDVHDSFLWADIGWPHQ